MLEVTTFAGEEAMTHLSEAQMAGEPRERELMGGGDRAGLFLPKQPSPQLRAWQRLLLLYSLLAM